MFRTRARLGATSPPPLAEALRTAYDAFDEVNRNRAGVGLGVADRLANDFSVLVGTGLSSARISCRHETRSEGTHIAGLSYLPPPGPETTESRIDLLLSEGPADGGPGPLWAGIRVTLAETTTGIRNGIAPPVPWSRLGKSYGFELNGYPLPPQPHTLSERGTEEELVPLLIDPDREHAVLVFSPLELTSRPILDPEAIQRALYGVCAVHVLANRRATFPLADNIGASFACYDGAVRLYLPGLGSDDPPSRHPLWKPDEQLADENFPGAVLRALNRGVSRTGRFPPLDWSVLSDSALRDLIGTVKGEDLVAALRHEKRALKDRVARLEERLDEERRRVRSLEDHARSLRDRLAVHEPEADLSSGAEGAESRMTPAAEATRNVAQAFPDRLALSLNNRSELDACPFEDVEALEGALRFLATTYWEARFGESRHPDLDAELHAMASGFSYRPHQSRGTMGRYAADYETTWEGRRYRLPYHLARGTSRDPRHTIRIGFDVDEERRVIVLGYIGQHQRTRKS